ncbi:MAG: small, acid-soluble spore protein, alpha/beta type [Solirubrobacterales bacterium]
MSNKPLVPNAEAGLDKFKMEVARDMSVQDKIQANVNMADMPSSTINKMKNSGNVGGEMVRRMVESYENNLKK